MLLNGNGPKGGRRTDGDERFTQALAAHGSAPLRRRAPSTLQVNLGKVCNQSCSHCHVDAGPTRTESMDKRTLERVLTVLARNPEITTLDITGGAPELNPGFRRLVNGALAAGKQVIDRCNLTVLGQPGQADTHEFLAARGVTVVASLPCYTAGNTDRQRGRGVFDESIRALKKLNRVGYGAAQGGPPPDDADEGEVLRLHLVFNPQGPNLPPAQEGLERDYRERLRDDHGIVFDRLYALANMPIHRFAGELEREGRLADYDALLAASFQPANVERLMCRDLLSVDWNGRLSDCDFNQMLGLPLGAGRRTIFDVDDLTDLAEAPIVTAAHCFGCTAGQGSGCSGALAAG